MNTAPMIDTATAARALTDLAGCAAAELADLAIAHAGTNRALHYRDCLRTRLAETLSVHERFAEEDRLLVEASIRYHARIDAAINPSEHIAAA